MGTILLRLAGPLQSWGADSRFVERTTRHEPTKSGVIGLVASALGRRRTEPVDDLAALPFGVRIDQPGSFVRDFQTAHKRVWNQDHESWGQGESMPLSNRMYLSDAIFVAGLEADDEMVGVIADALVHPVFPLFLGRRSCPPSGKILLAELPGICLMTALEEAPWQASAWYRRRKPTQVELPVVLDDAPEGSAILADEMVRDIPLSFSQVRRDYEWRPAVQTKVCVTNPDGRPQTVHNPFDVL